MVYIFKMEGSLFATHFQTLFSKLRTAKEEEGLQVSKSKVLFRGSRREKRSCNRKGGRKSREKYLQPTVNDNKSDLQSDLGAPKAIISGPLARKKGHCSYTVPNLDQFFFSSFSTLAISATNRQQILK